MNVRAIRRAIHIAALSVALFALHATPIVVQVPPLPPLMYRLASMPSCGAGSFPLWDGRAWECDDWGSLGAYTRDAEHNVTRWSLGL